MKITLYASAAGHLAGETFDCESEQFAEWLIYRGYATKADDEQADAGAGTSGGDTKPAKPQRKRKRTN